MLTAILRFLHVLHPFDRPGTPTIVEVLGMQAKRRTRQERGQMPLDQHYVRLRIYNLDDRFLPKDRKLDPNFCPAAKFRLLPLAGNLWRDKTS